MTMLHVAVRSALRRPGQALLISIAVVLATAFAAVSLLLATNARTALVAFGISVPAAADAVIVPSPELDRAAVAELAESAREVPGVQDVVVEHLGDVEVEVGGTTTTWKLTSDPGTGPLSAVPELASGHAPQVGEAVVGLSTADRAGVSVGDTLVVEGRQLTVAAIGPVHEFGQDVALIREEDAVALGESMSPVQIFLTGDPDLAELEEAISGGSIVAGGEERRAQEAAAVTDTLVGVLGALSLFVALAALAAVVIVSSTFRILLTRRATELSLLRCIGAGRGQLRRLVLLEAACIGLFGGIVGVAIGTGLAAAMVALARDAGLLTEPFDAAPAGLLACLVLAVVCAVVAALPAARAAGEAPPVEALGRSRSTEARPVRLRPRLLVASALTASALAAAGTGVVVSETEEFLGLALAALSGMLVFLAIVALGPFLVSSAAAGLSPLARRSVALGMAMSNARRASRRTAAMTTVLSLGVGLTAALTVGVAGVTQDSREDVARNFPATAMVPVDLVEDPEELFSQLAAHPDVDARIDGLDILIDPAPGVSDEDLRTAVLETADAGTSIYWTADVQSGIEQMILIGQAVGSAMIAVTVAVALIGVMVTLALSVAERRQEIALLRALGVSRAAARRSIAAEAALAALVGTTIGIVLGSMFGALALQVMDMPISRPPLGTLAALFMSLLGASVIAAAIPMRSAGRVPPAIGLAS